MAIALPCSFWIRSDDKASCEVLMYAFSISRSTCTMSFVIRLFSSSRSSVSRITASRSRGKYWNSGSLMLLTALWNSVLTFSTHTKQIGRAHV